jgi:hypothetical protein
MSRSVKAPRFSGRWSLKLREVLATSLAVNALVDQIHSAAVDILGGTGMDRSEALQVLKEATDRASGPAWILAHSHPSSRFLPTPVHTEKGLTN